MSRMSQKSIWEWFLAGRPAEADALPEIGKGGFHTAVLTCTVDEPNNGGKDSRLIIGIYGGGKDKPFIGAYYINGRGRYMSRQYGDDTWRRVALEYVERGGFSYYSYRSLIYSADGYSLNVARDWLMKHFRTDARHREWGSDDRLDSADMIVRKIGCIETDVERCARRTRREERDARITEWVYSIKDFPKDVNEYARRVLFGNRHYAFNVRTETGKKSKKKKKKAGTEFSLTCCGGRASGAETASWKNNTDVVCPRCGATVRVRKSVWEARRTESARLMVLCEHTDMRGDPCALACHCSCFMEWTADGEDSRFYVDAIIPIPKGSRYVEPGTIVYPGDSGWTDRNTYQYRFCSCYAYPDFSPLRGTEYDVRGLAEAAGQGWKLPYNEYMRYWRNEPELEYIIKGGFRRLAYELGNPGCPQLLPKEHKPDIRSALMLNGQSIDRLRRLDGGYITVLWLRAAEVCGYRLPDDTLRFWQAHRITPTDVAFALNEGVTPEQAAHYLEKQRRLHKGGPYGWFRVQWRDTLEMEKKLGIDLTKDCNLRPRDLSARHRELVDILNAEEEARRAEEMEALHAGCRDGCAAVKDRFEWSDGVHMTVVPSGAADIAREGRLLNHCVGTTDRYYDRIAAGESYVVFLRRASAPDQPWYTMEVEPGGRIRQLRTYGDNEGDERKEAKAFLAEWQKVVRSRLTDEQKREAETATERYLRELEALIASGSLIRNGRLAGKPIGKVLAADYEELNLKEG